MKKKLRILFVDDDPAWLNALKRSIRRSNPGWDVEFASNGTEALSIMATNPCDVIVSDLNMPGMRGDSLLDQISDTYPETLRFLLSGADASECSGRSSMLAMEFIPKETAAEELLFRIARGVTLRRFMRGRVVDRLADAVAKLGDLPNLTMKLINAEKSGGQPCIEVTCPDLGLEFRTSPGKSVPV